MADMTNGLSSVGTISLVDTETNIAHFIQTSNAVTFSPGIAQEIIYAANELGIEQPVKVRTTREDPTLQITFPRKTLGAIGFATGRKWKSAALANCKWVRTFVPTKEEYPAQTTGFEGFGVALDPANAIGSTLIAEVAEAATRIAYGTAGTPLVGTKSFAIGLNGALKFTTDLVDNPFTMEVPYTLPNVYELSEEYFRKLRMVVTLIMDDFKLVQLEFLEASPVLDNSSLNFGEPGLQATFRSMLTGASCVGYQMRYLGDKRRKC
jgi:hypothetical protein